MQKKNMIVTLLLVLGIVSITIGVTYAFFNYTRTGLANNIGTGRIYFNMAQNGKLQLTNIFPVKASEVDASSLDSVSVSIVGDTTYQSGEEYLISLVNVNNTINDKQIPINYIATYTANTDAVIGSSSNDYWNAREDKNANIYLLNETGSVVENKQVLVGFIKNDNTGINGTLTIKAYIDADRIAISDTYDGSEDDNHGTTSEWVNGRTVLTTEEWNSMQTTPISFQIRAESNEGIWVDEPSNGTIESCPECKFMYYVLDSGDETTWKWTTWNMAGYDETNNESYALTPTQITSGLYDNYEELISITGKNYFLGIKLNDNNEVTNAYACGVRGNVPFCIEGTVDGSKYTDNQTLLQGADLWNNTCNVESSYTECGPWDNSEAPSTYMDSIGGVDSGAERGVMCTVRSDGRFACIEP